ncbi:hypothetical protein BC941DRAFT_431481 [Chlamydoabsidia padenii]|nr:hypothetical protein BC941DRAFT_431481 [Chlamydoabsidia padenii]
MIITKLLFSCLLRPDAAAFWMSVVSLFDLKVFHPRSRHTLSLELPADYHHLVYHQVLLPQLSKSSFRYYCKKKKKELSMRGRHL